MGWLSVLLSGVAAYLLFSSGHTVLMVVAIATTVGGFWSWGVMHNYATDAAKRRSDYTGGFFDFTKEEAKAVPNWITLVNIRIKLSWRYLVDCGRRVQAFRMRKVPTNGSTEPGDNAPV
jgi:hypothetical protein